MVARKEKNPGGSREGLAFLDEAGKINYILHALEEIDDGWDELTQFNRPLLWR
jgi:hypothetical protein